MNQTPNEKRISMIQGISLGSTRSEISHKLQVYWYKIEQNFWRPGFRESCTMTNEGEQIYLHGGIGHIIYDELCQLNL